MVCFVKLLVWLVVVVRIAVAVVGIYLLNFRRKVEWLGVRGEGGGGGVVGHWLNYTTDNEVVLVQAKKIEKKLI